MEWVFLFHFCSKFFIEVLLLSFPNLWGAKVAIFPCLCTLCKSDLCKSHLWIEYAVIIQKGESSDSSLPPVCWGLVPIYFCNKPSMVQFYLLTLVLSFAVFFAFHPILLLVLTLLRGPYTCAPHELCLLWAHILFWCLEAKQRLG